MLARLGRTGTQTLSRFYATLTEAEKTIEQKLRAGLKVVDINVKDTSGGCGAMYSIEITADDFKGQSIVKQHQMVTKLIQEDIKQWHGFQLVTKASQ